MADDATSPPERVEKAWAGEPSEGSGMWGGTGAVAGDDPNYDPHKKPSAFAEVGATGLAQYGGFIRDEFLQALQGDNAIKTWREMWDNDAIVGSFIFAIQMLVRSVPWYVEPPEAATVEEITQDRIEERQQAAAKIQAATAAKLAQTQAGLAGKAPGQPAPGGGKPGAPPAPPMGRSPLASGADGPPTPITAPIGGSPTPSDSPGPNARDATTAPGTNQPATPNAPGTNPSGSPAQAAALQLTPGMGPGTKLKKPPSPSTPAGAAAFASSLDGRSWIRRQWDRITKAAPGAMPDASPGPAVDPMTGAPAPQEISDEDRAREELAVFVETCIHDMASSWPDMVAQIITMVVFGWYTPEICYKKRNGPNPDYPEQGSRFADGRIGWSKWASRAQETRHRWEFGQHGEVIGWWQLAPPRFQLRYLPLAKCLHFRTLGWKDNPEGRSLLRSAYRSWFFLKKIQEYEAIGVERDLAGLPTMRVPAAMMSDAATPEQKAALEAIKEMVRNVRRNEQEGLVIPNEFDPDSKEPLYVFELLASPSRRQFDTDKIITRYEQREAMTVLCDFILLGHEAVGARSLGETKADLLTTALEAFLDGIAEEINTRAVPRLMQINGEDPAKCPRIKHGTLESITLEELGKLITAMAGAGADLFPDPVLEDALRERAGLPPKAGSDDL